MINSPINLKITVVTVTYMARWHFLEKLVSRVLADEHVDKLIIVSNGSADIDKIRQEASVRGDQITLIELDKNYGSAVAFKKGLQSAGLGTSDYVLILDDDNVPEVGFGDIFFQNLNLFIRKEEKEKVVLLGNRNHLANNQDIFTSVPFKNHGYTNTFFSVFAYKKIKHFLKILFKIQKKTSHELPFLPITVTESFAYGGTLLPIEAVRKAAFPDERVFTYGDDIVYSWNVKNLGYKTYICSRPFIEDIDISLDAEYHFLAFFKESTHDFKVFFKIRNSAFLSMKYSKHPLITILNTYIWLLGLCVIATFRFGFKKIIFQRMHLIFQAAYRGLKQDFKLPKTLILPDSIVLSERQQSDQ